MLPESALQCGTSCEKCLPSVLPFLGHSSFQKQYSNHKFFFEIAEIVRFFLYIFIWFFFCLL